LSAWIGYGWIPFNPDAGETIHEHRVWQQLVAKHSTSTLSLQSRTRFEQRLRSDGDDLAFRVRQFFRAGIQLGDSSPYGLVMWNETFIGLSEPDWGARKGIDQNRLFVGGFVKLAPHLRLEGGYLSLYVVRNGDDLLGHVLATTLFVAL
jgi:hypothetical protein